MRTSNTIRIFDPEDKFTALASSKCEIKQGNICRANMGIASRLRGYSNTYTHESFLELEKSAHYTDAGCSLYECELIDVQLYLKSSLTIIFNKKCESGHISLVELPDLRSKLEPYNLGIQYT